MFEAITIRRQNLDDARTPLDVGFLLECMLFYRKVYVAGDWPVLAQLLRVFGPVLLEGLLEDGLLSILYEEQHAAISTHTDKQGFQFHSPVIFYSPNHSLANEIRKQMIEVTGKEGKGRRLARRFESLVTVVKPEDQFCGGVDALFQDAAFLQSATRAMVRRWVPEAGSVDQVVFHAQKTEKGHVISTNLNFDLLNRFYHQRVSPAHSTITSATFLAHVCAAEMHIYYSARQLSELATDLTGADLVAGRLAHLARRNEKGERARRAFAELVVDDAKALREVFNAGQIAIEEVVLVIRKAAKFKEWLGRQDIDADIIREYYKEVSKETLIDRLPAKTTRWATFTGLGIAADLTIAGGLGTATGVAVSMMDSFFLDKILKGWKPSQFLEDDLAKLVATTERQETE